MSRRPMLGTAPLGTPPTQTGTLATVRLGGGGERTQALAPPRTLHSTSDQLCRRESRQRGLVITDADEESNECSTKIGFVGHARRSYRYELARAHPPAKDRTPIRSETDEPPG